MKTKLWIGTILNFFLLGPGYLLFTPRKILGGFLTLGALGATYVEQFLLPGGAVAGGEPHRHGGTALTPDSGIGFPTSG